MRDEEIAFTTRGAGLNRRDVRRPPLTDGRTRPPPIAIGVRGSMTVGGKPFLAHHFSLLDANTAHKHTIAIRHVPETGPAFVTIGWAGIVYGMSGMSERGVGYACDPARHPRQQRGRLGARPGRRHLPGEAGRQGHAHRLPRPADPRDRPPTPPARATSSPTPSAPTGGPACSADKNGGLEAIEVDSDIFNDGSEGQLSAQHHRARRHRPPLRQHQRRRLRARLELRQERARHHHAQPRRAAHHPPAAVVGLLLPQPPRGRRRQGQDRGSEGQHRRRVPAAA